MVTSTSLRLVSTYGQRKETAKEEEGGCVRAKERVEHDI